MLFLRVEFERDSSNDVDGDDDDEGGKVCIATSASFPASVFSNSLPSVDLTSSAAAGADTGTACAAIGAAAAGAAGAGGAAAGAAATASAGADEASPPFPAAASAASASSRRANRAALSPVESKPRRSSSSRSSATLSVFRLSKVTVIFFRRLKRRWMIEREGKRKGQVGKKNRGKKRRQTSLFSHSSTLPLLAHRFLPLLFRLALSPSPAPPKHIKDGENIF